MTKIHDPASMRVTCGAGHYLGSLVNLVTGRAIYCEQCQTWVSWEDLNIGKKRKEGENK